MRTLQSPIAPTLLLIGMALLTGACYPPAPDYAAAMQPGLDAYIDAWSTGNLDQLDAVMSPNVRRRAPGVAGNADGLAAMKDVMQGLRTGYPDARVVVDNAWYQENKAFVRWTFSGTNTGPGETPPTGKAVTVSGLSLLEFENGMIVFEDVYYDTLPFMEQLGYTVVPPKVM